LSTFDGLKTLLDTFYRDIALARTLQSSNPHDDVAIRAAIVGFSYNSPTREWSKMHYEFVMYRLKRDYDDNKLSEYGRNAENVRLFFALSIGYLLGLYQQRTIGDAEFSHAEILIPGLIMQHLPRLTCQGAT
jgi:hypothetical protein